IRPEYLVLIDVADLLDRAPHHGLVVDVGVRGDLAGQNDTVFLAQDLTGHTTRRVLLQVRVEDGVRNEVAYLVRMPLGNGLRSKGIRRARGGPNRALQNGHESPLSCR